MTLSLITTTPASAILAVPARFARSLDQLCYRRSVGDCGRYQTDLRPRSWRAIAPCIFNISAKASISCPAVVQFVKFAAAFENVSA